MTPLPKPTTPIIKTEQMLRELIGQPMAALKNIMGTELDDNGKTLLTMTRLIGVCWLNSEGLLDANIISGEEGFIEVLDDHTLRLTETGAKVLENAVEVGLLCMVPGYQPTVRINGRLRDSSIIDIKEFFLHCPKAFMRSKLWTSSDVKTPIVKSESESDTISEEAKTWLERSPLTFLGSGNRTLGLDLSPRGDPAGFIRVIDEKTLLIPERPGNRIANTLRNVIESSQVGLVVLQPGVNASLQIRGQACLTANGALLEGSAIKGKVPKLGIWIDVEQVCLSHQEQLNESKIWLPETYRSSDDGLLSFGQLVVDQLLPSKRLRKLKGKLANIAIQTELKHTLY